jgi:hypothetical protein
MPEHLAASTLERSAEHPAMMSVPRRLDARHISKSV